MDELNKTLEAVSGISDTVSMAYKDLAQPAVQEVGKGLHTVSKTIHIALAPVSALVWGYDKISQYVQTSLEEKLKNVPEENITTPDPSVAVPAVEALRYTAHNEDLREMFSNLLATAMDKTTVQKAHPSFVEILKQISSDEAKIIRLLEDDKSKAIIKLRAYNQDNDHYAEPLKEFSMLPLQAGCDYPELGPGYLVNIARLGLAQISYSSYSTLPNSYEPILEHPVFVENQTLIEAIGKRTEVQRGTFTRTPFGEKFYEACILGK